MFERVKGFALRKAYALAKRKGVSCPDCGQRVVLPDEMPEGELEGDYSCGECEWTGSLLNTIEMGVGVGADSPLKEQPMGSRIERRGTRWVIPGTGKPNGEWFFGAIWTSAILAFGLMFLWQVEGEIYWVPFLVGLLFMMPFFAAGGWILYLASRKTFREVVVQIDGAKVRVTRRLFAMVKEERIPKVELAGVKLKIHYDSDSGRTADLKIQRVSGKDLKVEVDVSIDEKRWLLHEWREELGMNEIRTEKNWEVTGKRQGEFQGRAIQEKGVELEPKESGIFFLTVRNRMAPWLIGVGGFVMMLGFVLGGSILKDMASSVGVPFFFGVFVESFGFIFSLLPLVGGAVALVWGLRTFGEVRKYAFYPDRIEYAKVKREGKVVADESWPRESVKNVVVTYSGESNGEARFRVQLRMGRNVSLVPYVSEEVARELEGWVRRWFEGEQSS